MEFEVRCAQREVASKSDVARGSRSAAQRQSVSGVRSDPSLGVIPFQYDEGRDAPRRSEHTIFAPAPCGLWALDAVLGCSLKSKLMNLSPSM